MLQSSDVQTTTGRRSYLSLSSACVLAATDARTTSGHGQSTWAVHGELNGPENAAQEDRLNLEECWDVFRPHRQHLGRRRPNKLQG